MDEENYCDELCFLIHRFIDIENVGDGVVRCNGFEYSIRDDKSWKEEEFILETFSFGCLFTDEEIEKFSYFVGDPDCIVPAEFLLKLFVDVDDLDMITDSQLVDHLWDYFLAGYVEDEKSRFFGIPIDECNRAYIDFVGGKLEGKISWTTNGVRNWLEAWPRWNVTGITGFFYLYDLLGWASCAGVSDVASDMLHEQFDDLFKLLSDVEFADVFLDAIPEDWLIDVIIEALPRLCVKHSNGFFVKFLSAISPEKRIEWKLFDRVISTTREMNARSAFAVVERVEVVKLYLSHIGDVKELDGTTLVFAVLCGDMEMVHLLVQSGADLSPAVRTLRRSMGGPSKELYQYIKKREKLWQLLKKQTDVKTSEYHLYYNTPGCITAANNLNATFAGVQHAYDTMHKKRRKHL